MSKKRSERNISRSAGLIANRVALLFLTLALSIAVIAQPNSWDLGPYKLLTGPSSPPLRVTMNGGRGLTSFSFVGRVGGIAFEAVAVPNKAVKGKDIKLSYDKSQKDGNRLAISIGGKTYRPSLPDWMLVPISKYADSPYTACVSLFGPRSTRSSYDIVYHPAFQDTLMGLRLLQADMLLIDVGNFWDLPKFNGKIVRGLGEPMPVKPAGLSAALSIRSVFGRTQFQSWVLTDYRVPVSFNVNRDAFMLSGEPYYYFWKPDIQGNNREPQVIEVRSLTEGLKAKRGEIKKLNPIVYNAASKTMQFAAFFRFVKRSNPALWSSFLNQVRGATVRPIVKTPTQWRR
jgi:hypothetical protein